jgi:lipopolysaccharide biosynthesis glycosyltransferase
MIHHRYKNKSEFLALEGRKRLFESQYETALLEPAVIHFTTKDKPWLCVKPEFADRWWFWAQKSPFFVQLAEKYLCNAIATAEEIKQQVKDTYAAATGTKAYRLGAKLLWLPNKLFKSSPFWRRKFSHKSIKGK